MNNDLISRETLKNHIIEIFDEEVKHDKKWAMGLKYSLKIIDNTPTVDLKDIYQEGHYNGHLEGYTKAIDEERPTGGWIITAEDSEGIHRIQCPFCRYEKGSDFIDYIIVTFEKFPPFCENCGAALRGTINDT